MDQNFPFLGVAGSMNRAVTSISNARQFGLRCAKGYRRCGTEQPDIDSRDSRRASSELHGQIRN